MEPAAAALTHSHIFTITHIYTTYCGFIIDKHYLLR
jgi:hypothetical protein